MRAKLTRFPQTAPIWGYCGQTGHCAAGMVFSINAVESGPNNFENFQLLAEETGNATTTATTPVASPTTSQHSGTLSIRTSIPIAFGFGLAGLLASLL